MANAADFSKDFSVISGTRLPFFPQFGQLVLFVPSLFVRAQQSMFIMPFMQDTSSNHGCYTDFLSFQILYHMPGVTTEILFQNVPL